MGYVSPAQPSSPVFINAITRDVDGDVITLQYDWYLNGQPVGNESSLMQSIPERGDQVQAQITPYSNGVNGVSYLTDIVDIETVQTLLILSSILLDQEAWMIWSVLLTQPSDPDGDPTVHNFRGK